MFTWFWGDNLDSSILEVYKDYEVNIRPTSISFAGWMSVQVSSKLYQLKYYSDAFRVVDCRKDQPTLETKAAMIMGALRWPALCVFDQKLVICSGGSADDGAKTGVAQY